MRESRKRKSPGCFASLGTAWVCLIWPLLSFSLTLRCSSRGRQFWRLWGWMLRRWPPAAWQTPPSNAAPTGYAQTRAGWSRNTKRRWLCYILFIMSIRCGISRSLGERGLINVSPPRQLFCYQSSLMRMIKQTSKTIQSIIHTMHSSHKSDTIMLHKSTLSYMKSSKKQT